MGPFELMDLVGRRHRLRGLQVLLRAELRRAALAAVRRSRRGYVAAGRLGARSGAATTTTRRPGSRRTGDPEPPARGPAAQGAVVDRRRRRARRRAARAAERGRLRACADCVELGRASCPDADRRLRRALPLERAARRAAPHAVILCADGASLSALDPGGSAVGFHALPPLADTQLVELTRPRETSDHWPRSARSASSRTLGKHAAWVGDAPGLVLGRIVCQSSTKPPSRSARASARRDGRRPGMLLGLQLPARAARVGRRDRPRPRARDARRAARGARRGALPRRAGAAPSRARRPGPGVKVDDRLPG